MQCKEMWSLKKKKDKKKDPNIKMTSISDDTSYKSKL